MTSQWFGLSSAGYWRNGTSGSWKQITVRLRSRWHGSSKVRPLHPDVPILFMTGKCPSALIGSFFDPAENLLFKPFDPDTFLDIVARLLESHLNQRRVTA